MTINTNDVRNEYTAGASQTIFNYTFKIYATTDLNVYVTPAGQACVPGDLTTAYTVTGVGLEAGGTITLTTPTASGDLVTIVSNIPDNRTTDYQNNGDFRPDTVNDDFDRVVSLVKQNNDKVERTVAFEECEQGVSGLTLPTPVANAFWRMKPDLTGVENFTFGSTGLVAEVSVTDFTALKALTSADYTDGQVIFVTNKGIAGEFIVRTGTVSDNGGTQFPFDDDANRYADRYMVDGSMLSAAWFGADGTLDPTGALGTVDQTANIQAAINAAAVDGMPSGEQHKSVFVPAGRYRVTGLDAGQRVNLVGENRRGCSLWMESAGDFGIEKPAIVSGFFFTSSTAVNGPNRIDEAGWTRADRGNTGVIMGPADESFEAGNVTIKECRFTNLAVGIEGANSNGTLMTDHIFQNLWHCIFFRPSNFASYVRIQNCQMVSAIQGICAGFYSSPVSGYNSISMQNCVFQSACLNVAHNGIHGFFETFGTSMAPGPWHIDQMYMENDAGTNPTQIALRAPAIDANTVWFQGFFGMVATPTTSAFWYIRNSTATSTPAGATYNLIVPAGSTGRCRFDNVAFDKGLNPSQVPFVTLVDCSGTGILPTGNSNLFMDDGNITVQKQSGTPLTSNRRGGEGTMLSLEHGSTQNFRIDSDGTATSLIAAESGGFRLNGQNSNGVDTETQTYRKTATSTAIVLRVKSNVTSNDATKAQCEADGDWFNVNGTYGTISDRRAKTGIVDANSQWDDLKNIKFRRYQKIDEVEALGEDAPWHLGVVTQELEEAGMSGLVKYSALEDEDGNLIKDDDGEYRYNTAKSSIMYMKCAKALQEAMLRIEALEKKLSEHTSA